MRSVLALGFAALLAGPIVAVPAPGERKLGDMANGQIQVNFLNGTRGGCVDKDFQWVTDDASCARFRVRLGDFDPDAFVRYFRMINSEGWGCFSAGKSSFYHCEEGIAGGLFISVHNRVPRDGDIFDAGSYGLGVPGTCEASPLEIHPKVHKFEIAVKLAWFSVENGDGGIEPSGPTTTQAPRLADAAACTSTSTLTPVSTHHTFPTNAPFSVHFPGNLNVIYKNETAGCLQNDGKWTANRNNCGAFKAAKLTSNDTYIELTTEKGYCAPWFEKARHIICTNGGVSHGMHVDGYNLVNGQPKTINWLGSALPQGDNLEFVSREYGDLEVQVEWETIPINGN